MIRSAALLLATAALLGGGCASGDDHGGVDEGVTAAESLDPALAPPTTPSPGTVAATAPALSPGEPAPVTTAVADPAAGTPAPVATVPPPPTEALVVAVEDATGDAGGAPPWADLVRVVLDDLGDRARVVIDVAGDLPATTAEGEVLGIGVDLYDDAGGEGIEQVFVLGESTGFTAYLTTPDGDTIALPGTLEIGAGRIVVELPRFALGTRPSGRLGAFADWSATGLVLGQEARDDIAPVPYAW